MGSEAEFAVADAQTLEPFSDSSFDIVYSTYICWFEDLFLSCRNWHRVLKPGGRLLLTTGHPITSCLYETDGVLTVEYDYLHPSPEYFVFDGTPLDRRHGGYQNDEEIVEFFHPVAEVVNAMVQAEFSIRRMGELPDPHTDETGGQLSKLPDLLSILAEKTGSKNIRLASPTSHWIS